MKIRTIGELVLARRRFRLSNCSMCQRQRQRLPPHTPSAARNTPLPVSAPPDHTPKSGWPDMDASERMRPDARLNTENFKGMSRMTGTQRVWKVERVAGIEPA